MNPIRDVTDYESVTKQIFIDKWNVAFVEYWNIPDESTVDPNDIDWLKEIGKQLIERFEDKHVLLVQFGPANNIRRIKVVQ